MMEKKGWLSLRKVVVEKRGNGPEKTTMGPDSPITPVAKGRWQKRNKNASTRLSRFCGMK